MPGFDSRGPWGPAGFPLLGLLTLAAVWLFMCLLPVFLVDTLHSALERLHLGPVTASWSVIGIVIGSLINLPIYRIDRLDPQPEYVWGAYGVGWLNPRLRWTRTQTIIAVNVGGCVIPVLLAARQVAWLSGADRQALSLAALVTLANVIVCYRVARPVPGIGIMMPGIVSPLVAVGMTWLLQVHPEHAPAVAFIGGVLGPLIGADLLHLKDISRMSAGVLSIGGAGTFDGIVLSGVLAALVA